MSLQFVRRLGAVATVLLGLSACGASELFVPDAAQGIEGVALRGPMCPVQSQNDPCPDQPHQAWVTVRLASGAFVTRFQTAEDGTFQVGLRAGRYTLDPESGHPFPIASQQSVEVLEGRFTDVLLSFDTGIR